MSGLNELPRFTNGVAGRAVGTFLRGISWYLRQDDSRRFKGPAGPSAANVRREDLLKAAGPKKDSQHAKQASRSALKDNAPLETLCAPIGNGSYWGAGFHERA